MYQPGDGSTGAGIHKRSNLPAQTVLSPLTFLRESVIFDNLKVSQNSVNCDIFKYFKSLHFIVKKDDIY